MDSHEIENLKSESKAAFLPFGFRGIARFGYARNVFLFSIELTVVLFFSLCVLWFVCGNWFPVISDAVTKLPDAPVRIANGQLEWDEKDGVLAQTSKLAIVVNAYGNRRQGRESDMALELAENSLNIYTCGRYLNLNYKENLIFNLDRMSAVSWWYAWRGAVVFWICFIPFFFLFIVFQLLSLIYMPFVRGIAALFRRNCSWVGAYMLSGATLAIPGIILGLGVIGYSGGCYGVSGLGVIVLLALSVSWIFLLGAPLLLPRKDREINPSKKRFRKKGLFSAEVDEKDGTEEVIPYGFTQKTEGNRSIHKAFKPKQ